MSETVIDRAFAAMQAAPEDEAAHLAFYERVADAELYLLSSCVLCGLCCALCSAVVSGVGIHVGYGKNGDGSKSGR